MDSKYIYIIFFFLIVSNVSAQILFEDEAFQRGITSNAGIVPNGTGISFVDYNGDGWDDVTVPSGDNVPLRFYKNIGGVFVEEILISPQITYLTRAVSWVDYDNDGDKDLFVASDTHGNRLYKQNPDGSFVDVTIASGLFTDNVFTYGISWGDYNNDGCLDFYMSNRTIDHSISNFFFKNNCDGTFTDATESARLINEEALTFCSAFFDYNNDGWQDLYVSNDKISPNILYKNNGNGTFTDVSSITNTDIVIDAMSVTIDDYNSDGYFDIHVTNTPNDLASQTLGSVLLMNNSGNNFIDVSISSGTQFDSWTWGSNFLDAENDGDLDLYISSFYTSLDSYPSFAFYKNNADDTFNESNNSFVNNSYNSYGSATGDVNNDGLVDIAVFNSNNTSPNLWINKTNTTNNFLTIELVGKLGNKDALGSVIEISINDNKQYRYITNGESYLSQNSLKEYFGLNTATVVDYIKIKWLSGAVDMIFDVDANQHLKIIEGNNLLSIDDPINNPIKIWPNPTTDAVNINSIAKVKGFSIYDMSGKKIFNKKVNEQDFSINFSGFLKGVYFLNIKTELGQINHKIIKD